MDRARVRAGGGSRRGAGQSPQLLGRRAAAHLDRLPRELRGQVPSRKRKPKLDWVLMAVSIIVGAESWRHRCVAVVVVKRVRSQHHPSSDSQPRYRTIGCVRARAARVATRAGFKRETCGVLTAWQVGLFAAVEWESGVAGLLRRPGR